MVPVTRERHANTPFTQVGRHASMKDLVVRMRQDEEQRRAAVRQSSHFLPLIPSPSGRGTPMRITCMLIGVAHRAYAHAHGWRPKHRGTARRDRKGSRFTRAATRVGMVGR